MQCRSFWYASHFEYYDCISLAALKRLRGNRALRCRFRSLRDEDLRVSLCPTGRHSYKNKIEFRHVCGDSSNIILCQLNQNVGLENGLLCRHLDCKCGSIGVCFGLLKHAFHNHVCIEQNNKKKGAGICLPSGPPIQSPFTASGLLSMSIQ